MHFKNHTSSSSEKQRSNNSHSTEEHAHKRLIVSLTSNDVKEQARNHTTPFNHH